MPRLTNRLTDMVIRRSKPDISRNKVLIDGNGLRLIVTASAHKHFEFKSAVGGTERTVRLGRYPDLTLYAARKEAARLRQIAKDGLNPVAEKRVERLRNRTLSGTTFEKVAQELLLGKQKNTKPSYFKRMTSAIRSNLYPILGPLPIQSIDAPILREALQRIEARGALDMLTDVRRWASEIFDFAKANGQYKGDNPADALSRNVFQKHSGSHMRALEWSDMAAFWNGLNNLPSDPATIAAIKLIVLTACRPGEVRGARWEEFDLGKSRWNIPGTRMKMGKAHSVPLSRQSKKVLADLKILTGYSEYLFPSRTSGGKSKTISDMGILKAVKQAAKKDVHVHGFRSTFATHVSTSRKWDDKVKEAALAHGKRGMEGIYDRATHYLDRVKLMQWWANEIEKVSKGASLVAITRVAA